MAQSGAAPTGYWSRGAFLPHDGQAGLHPVLLAFDVHAHVGITERSEYDWLPCPSFGTSRSRSTQWRTHPGIQITLTIDNRVLDLSRREAEVALRTRRPTEGDLFGRKLAGIAGAFYGTPTQKPLKRRGDSLDFTGRDLIGWDEPSDRIVASAWLPRHVPAAQIICRSNSIVHQLMAARAKIGIALSPCYLADPIPELQRLSSPVDELQGELWIVTHKTLKDTARARACLTISGDGIASMH